LSFLPKLSHEAPTLTIDGTRVDAFGCSDVGHVRTQNQDQYLIATLHRTIEIESTSIPAQQGQQFGPGARALLLLVADGVGGGAGGEEASAWTLDTIVRYVAGSPRLFTLRKDEEQRELLNDLTLAVQWSHAAVRDRGIDMPELAGMATTLTMALVTWPTAFVIQIGDSRCYHLRDDQLRQVTTDQTMARELIRQGVMPEEAAERSPLSQVLSQSIGHQEPDVWPVISELVLESGDTLLLCSDGLMKHVPDAEIGELLRSGTSAKEAASGLVGAALEAGGTDNVTVLAARFH
jgi:PPM family protein phosphatase